MAAVEARSRDGVSGTGDDRKPHRVSTAKSRNRFTCKYLLGLLLAFAICGLGVREWQGQAHFSVVVAALRPCNGSDDCPVKPNPAVAFQKNWDAFRANPWDWLIRYQLALTFMNLDRIARVDIDRESFDRVWTISETATPYSKLLRAGKEQAEQKRGWK